MAQAAPLKCPVCAKPAAEKYQPFCCARCANVDLGRWLGEHYRLPTNEAPQDMPVEHEPGENEEI